MVRVLFIDDDPQAQDTLGWILAERYTVLAAASAAEGLSLLEEIVARPSAPPLIMLTA